jgi:hypothetical protein
MTLAIVFVIIIVALLAYAWALHHLPAPAPAEAVRVVFTIGDEELTMLKIQATAAAKRLVLRFKDAKGNLAQVEGVPAWGMSDPSLGSLAVAEDGLSAVFTPGSVGTGQVNVSADADLGEGVKTITGILDVEVIAGEATVVEIGVEDIPEVPAAEGTETASPSRSRRPSHR